MREQCTHRTLVGRVTQGNSRSRRAFHVAGPTYVAPVVDMFGTMYDQLTSAIPEAAFLAPIFIPLGEGGGLRDELLSSKACSEACAPLPLFASLWKRPAGSDLFIVSQVP